MKIKTKYRLLVVKKILLLIAIALFMTACAISIYELLDLFYMTGTIILSIIILVYIAFKCGLVSLLRDKEWRGYVKGVSVIQDREPVTLSIAVGKAWQGGMPKIIDYTVIEAVVDGKVKKLKIPSNKIGVRVFKAGDKIVHYRGMNYPHNPERNDDIHICPMCARSLHADFCPDCRLDF